MEKSRLEFVVEALAGEKSMSQLCREYEVSRPTGYKWLRRYQAGEPLRDQSHASRRHPNRTPPEVEALLVAARNRHPTWGGRKLVRYLEDQGYSGLPAASTATEILRRHGLISPEESEKHTPYRRFQMERPNQLWQMDFKGHFALTDGTRCHPLTISDDHSRRLLCLDAYDNERWPSVQGSLLRVFQENGLPEAILSDNGPPWGDNANGYTPYEVWMMQLGILPIHGRPLHPQTQGKTVFDAYRAEFNQERPHAALGYDVPDRHYTPSPRPLPGSWGEPEYDAGLTLRRVNSKGYLSIQGRRYYLSEAMIGKYVELRFRPDNLVDLCYGPFRIASIDLSERLFRSRKISRIPPLNL